MSAVDLPEAGDSRADTESSALPVRIKTIVISYGQGSGTHQAPPVTRIRFSSKIIFLSPVRFAHSSSQSSQRFKFELNSVFLVIIAVYK